MQVVQNELDIFPVGYGGSVLQPLGLITGNITRLDKRNVAIVAFNLFWINQAEDISVC